ncbi:septum formation family protein, partial [Rathayibacter tanaceti]
LQQEAAPAAAPTVAETPAPTAAVPLPTAGPLPAGTWAWTELLGGECVQPFDSVWAEQFTVVDCGAGHEAQLVARAELPDTAFPGQEALAVSVSSLCQAQGVVDVAAAGAYGDVQVSGSFPVTQEQWDAGERSYYCFVDRAGGGELVGSLAATPAA